MSTSQLFYNSLKLGTFYFVLRLHLLRFMITIEQKFVLHGPEKSQ